MRSYQASNIRKYWFPLLVIIFICLILSQSPATNPSRYFFPSDTRHIAFARRKSHEGCDAFNPHVSPKDLFQSFFSVLNDSVWLVKPSKYSPSFQELHNLLFGLATPNLYESWPNYFKKKIDSTYPHTSLTESLLKRIFKHVDIPIHFVVEVGSFMGKSATNIAKVLTGSKLEVKPVLLCIDTWLGALEHWTIDSERQMMQVEYGRPTVYEQFIANIVGNNLTNYVIPFSATSILGARFLLEQKLFPQIVYLDSAHLQGETYVELELYWLLLQTGGMLVGDDWSWTAVRCDILRFIDNIKVNITVIGETWFIQKNK